LDEPVTLAFECAGCKSTVQIKTSVYAPSAGRLSTFPFVWSDLACVLRRCSWRSDARCHRLRGKAPVPANQPGLAASASNRTMRARGPPGSRTPRPTAPSSRSVPSAVATRAPFQGRHNEPSVTPAERGLQSNPPSQASRPVKSGCGARLLCSCGAPMAHAFLAPDPCLEQVASRRCPAAPWGTTHPPKDGLKNPAD
jgi:hypothetical protein